MSDGHANRKYLFLIAAAVVLLDRLTKWIVAKDISLHDSIQIIPGFFKLTHVQNRGAAFGMFDQTPSPWITGILVLFSLAAMLVVSVLLWKNSATFSAPGVGLSLILGGALGNLWDRLFAGRVVDFLDFYIGAYHWPAFNIADTAIVVGACLLVGEIVFAKHPNQEPAR